MTHGMLRSCFAAAIYEEGSIVATTADEYEERVSKPQVQGVDPIGRGSRTLSTPRAYGHGYPLYSTDERRARAYL